MRTEKNGEKSFIFQTILLQVLQISRNYNRPYECAFSNLHIKQGARGNVVVKVLCYKPEGRGDYGDSFNFTD
jgi:hypothetical protein